MNKERFERLKKKRREETKNGKDIIKKNWKRVFKK